MGPVGRVEEGLHPDAEDDGEQESPGWLRRRCPSVGDLRRCSATMACSMRMRAVVARVRCSAVSSASVAARPRKVNRSRQSRMRSSSSGSSASRTDGRRSAEWTAASRRDGDAVADLGVGGVDQVVFVGEVVAHDGGAAPAGVGDAPVGGRGEAAGRDEVGRDPRDVATSLLMVCSCRHLTDSISYLHHLVYIK